MVIPDNRFRPLPSEIIRRRQLAGREADEGVVWRDDAPEAVGRKIGAILPLMTNKEWLVYENADAHRLVGSESSIIEFSTKDTLAGRGSERDRLDAIAAIVYSFVRLSVTDDEEVENGWDHQYVPPRYDVDSLVETVNDILLAARVEWHFADGEFVQRGNSVLYADVVKPATILLDSNPKFSVASSSFNTAITHLSENKSAIAVTEAAVSVQEFFRAIGVNGNSISDQLDAAKNANVITGEDRALLKPFVGWMNADRSNRGIAHFHREGDVSKADAWLAIHIAGALIVRLSNEDPRDILAARAKRDAHARATKEGIDRIAQEEAVSAATDQTEVNGFKVSGASDVWNTNSGFSDASPF